ncbi:hypothetical protein [Camelimonas lactis]|nr:hypothetical protein [Camelimonas lactis]
MSRDGAAEALRLAMSELDMLDDDDAPKVMIRAALGYLEAAA